MRQDINRSGFAGTKRPSGASPGASLIVALRTVFLCTGLLGAPGLQAQSIWELVHFQQFADWDAVCDRQVNPKNGGKRCYVRNVARFEDEPRLGALIVFVTVSRDGARVELVGPEGGSIIEWRAGGDMPRDRLESSPVPVSCGQGRTCTLDASRSRAFIDAAESVDPIALCFLIGGKHACRDIPTSGFEEALVDASRAYMMGDYE